MIDEAGIWRAAEVLIDQYGVDAVSQAKSRAGDMLSRGEVEGHAVWNRILAAVRDLLRDGGKGPLH
jgi:hypothetical protein